MEGIVAQAFGVPSSLLSNRLISEIASRKARELCAPVYTQVDVMVEPKIEVEFTKEQPGYPPPTLRIARGAVQWAMRRGITNLLIVAAKPHMWRCVRDLTYAVREAGAQIKVNACEEVRLYSNEWFCVESGQKRTRTKWEWWSRELIIMLMPFFIYKRIAR